jgi:hypothetical protein
MRMKETEKTFFALFNILFFLTKYENPFWNVYLILLNAGNTALIGFEYHTGAERRDAGFRLSAIRDCLAAYCV